MADKPKTTDEYVLAELERYKNLSSKLKAENADLQAELEKKAPALTDPTINLTPYVCYGYEVISSYDFKALDNPLTAAQIQELLDDDSAFRTWAATALYKSYGKCGVLRIKDIQYTMEANCFGLLVAVIVNVYYDNTASVNACIIDNKNYFKDRDDAKEAGLKELKAVLTKRLEVALKEEAEAAAKAAETKSEAEPEPENK